MKGDAVAFYSLSAENNSERKIEFLKHGPLFYMQFEICGGILTFLFRVGESIHFNAATSQRVFHFYSVAVGANTISGNGMSARKRRRSQQAASEPRAFFIGPVHQTYGNRWPPVEFRSKTAKHFERGHHIQSTIEPPAIRHGI